MLVRLNQVKFKPGQGLMARDIAERELIPVMKKHRGFQGWYALQAVDNEDEGLSLGFWDSMEDFEEARQDHEYVLAVHKIQAFYSQPATQRLYEVKSKG